MADVTSPFSRSRLLGGTPPPLPPLSLDHRAVLDVLVRAPNAECLLASPWSSQPTKRCGTGHDLEPRR